MAAIGSASTRAPTDPATSAALSARKSLTTVTLAPRTRLLSASTWKAPIMPTPRTAILRSSLIGCLRKSMVAPLQELR